MKNFNVILYKDKIEEAELAYLNIFREINLKENSTAFFELTGERFKVQFLSNFCEDPDHYHKCCICSQHFLNEFIHNFKLMDSANGFNATRNLNAFMTNENKLEFFEVSKFCSDNCFNQYILKGI